MWGYATVDGGGVPTLQASYNVTSIADTGAGILTVTVATDFADANWAALATASESNMVSTVIASQAAGSIAINCRNEDDNFDDPTAWSFLGLGDHA
jgi:hypothetical protein